MEEYFFKTDELINMEGSKMKKVRKEVSYFESHYDYQVTYEYDLNKIIDFLRLWDKEQKLKTAPYKRGMDFCYYIIDKLNEDKNLSPVFISIENKLIGFSVGELITKDHWIGLHMKIDYNYKGLGRWLYREQAKLFQGTKYKAAGGGVADPGITYFKKSMNPYQSIPYYHLKLGGQK